MKYLAGKCPYSIVAAHTFDPQWGKILKENVQLCFSLGVYYVHYALGIKKF